MGSTTQAYLVAHMAHAQCGRRGFAQWLLPPPGPGKPLALPPLAQGSAAAAAAASPKPKSAVKRQVSVPGQAAPLNLNPETLNP